MENNYFISHDGFHIPLNSLDNSKLNSIKKELTVSPSNLDFVGINAKNDKKSKSYKLYTTTDKHIIVPRYFGIEFCNNNKIKNIIQHDLTNVEKINIKFNGELRDYQSPIVQQCLNHITSHGGGLLSVFCGWGKTNAALYISCVLGVKTLVVVHKSQLMDQWIERIEKFTNASYGIIRGKKSIIDKNIVIAMIQTISKPKFTTDMFKQFGLVILDESHHSPANFFSKTLMKTCCPYTLALSATPYRGDGLIKVMHWFLGDTIYKAKKRKNDLVVVKMFHYFSTDQLFKEKKRLIKGQVRPDIIKMMGNLCKLSERSTHIANIINAIRLDPNRVLLTLSERISQLDEIKKLVDNSIEEDIKNKKLVKDEIKTSFYIGKMKPNERAYAEKMGDILFATNPMAKEGLDIERLNTVALATSQKDIVQSVGRAMRKLLKTGDLRPLIIDFSDDLSSFIKHSEKREKHYKKCKYLIEHFYLYNNKILSETEYLLLKNKHKISFRDYILKNIKELSLNNINDIHDINNVIKDLKNINTDFNNFMIYNKKNYSDLVKVELAHHDQQNDLSEGTDSSNSNSSFSYDSDSDKNPANGGWGTRLF